MSYPDSIIYHDLGFASRFQQYIDKIVADNEIDSETHQLSKIAGWIFAASWENIVPEFSKKEFKSNREEVSLETLEVFLAEHPLDDVFVEKLKAGLSDFSFGSHPKTMIGKILHDGTTADLVMGNSKKVLKKIHEELLLKDVTLSKKKWYDVSSEILSELSFNLPHCKAHYDPLLDDLLLEIQKDKKKLGRSADLALKKELDISDAELKQLKKNLANSKGRDDRGIQTLFRTTSKNHYTLNEMVDRKASIMITVNSIILSLVLGGILRSTVEHGHPHFSVQNLAILALTLTSIFSIIFAILSIRPAATHGEFTEEEIRNQEGNLLFYGNFHQMQQRDYEWAFLRMTNDQDYLYSSMVRDIFFLGKLLAKKYKLIRMSLTIFLVGLVIAVLISIVGQYCM